MSYNRTLIQQFAQLGKVFSFGVAVSGTTAQHSLVQLWNPNGSGKNLNVYVARIRPLSVTNMILTLYNTQLSGTTINLTNHLSGGPASVASAVSLMNASIFGNILSYDGASPNSGNDALVNGDVVVVAPNSGILIEVDDVNVGAWFHMAYWEE